MTERKDEKDFISNEKDKRDIFKEFSDWKLSVSVSVQIQVSVDH